MPADAAELEQIQRWFHAAVTRPDVRPERVADLVLPSNALDSAERLSIYANMYFDRLTEILGDEFPSVEHLLGPQTFATVVRDYVTEHPSTHYSLAQLGRKFPQFLLTGADASAIGNPQFAAAVATVERTMEDVFDEQQDDPLTFDKLQAVDPGSWDHVRLKTISALRLLRLPYPVNNYISAVRDGKSIGIPAAEPAFVVVYRRNYRVWRADIDARQFTLLSGLAEGLSLGDAVSACAESPDTDPAELAGALHDWFRNWTADGFFHAIESDEVMTE